MYALVQLSIAPLAASFRFHFAALFFCLLLRQRLRASPPSSYVLSPNLRWAPGPGVGCVVRAKTPVFSRSRTVAARTADPEAGRGATCNAQNDIPQRVTGQDTCHILRFTDRLHSMKPTEHAFRTNRHPFRIAKVGLYQAAHVSGTGACTALFWRMSSVSTVRAAERTR